MGRNAKPVDIHLQDRKKHLTKAEIEARKKAEIKYGDAKITCPLIVKQNKVAYKRWKELMKLYKEVDFVSSADTTLLAKYCLTHAEYIQMVEQRKELMTFEFNYGDFEVGSAALDEMGISDNQASKMLAKMEYLLSLDGVLKLDKAINTKLLALLKMEDMLFLTPLSRVRNVPKPEKKEETELTAKGFDDV